LDCDEKRQENRTEVAQLRFNRATAGSNCTEQQEKKEKEKKTQDLLQTENMAKVKKYCKQRVSGSLDSRTTKLRTCI
jgi:hypothetical protein